MTTKDDLICPFHKDLEKRVEHNEKMVHRIDKKMSWVIVVGGSNILGWIALLITIVMK